MDVSEIWDHLPAFLAPAVALAIGWMAFRMKRGRVRFSAFASSLVLLIMSGSMLIAELILMHDTVRRPNVFSPDRGHVAVTRWLVSRGTGCDYVVVSVRSRLSPFPTDVFAGCAANAPNEPQVKWVSNDQLLITFREGGSVSRCWQGPDLVKGIRVLCEQ